MIAPLHVAEAADDGRREGLEGDGGTHLDRDEQDRRDQDAREAAEQGAEYTKVSMIIAPRECQAGGHLLVLRSRLHLLAEQGVLEEPDT